MARRELSLRQRRELGITIPAILAAATALKDSGQIDGDSSFSEVAALVAVHLQTKNPTAYAAVADWESILAFIETMLPIILKLLSLL